MISAMIMMPKLQFLATGGYDGKLILWDTISQTKKFKYKEHTRSISSMAFHEGLILLFTAAYDHSVCIWNPYIQSLIHKVITNVNVVQLDIIPDSHLLIALDAESNVKIREVNKFSLVSSFSIDRHDCKLEPSCMVASTSPLRYFFGGLAVAAYEYIHIDANVILDSTVLCLKYHPSSFTLYSPVKNHIVAWDLLTGAISNTLRNQSPAEITAFGMFEGSRMAVVGDAEGNVLLRKLENGVLVKKLYKHKNNITAVLAEDLRH
jgi:WD40 repeat protein